MWNGQLQGARFQYFLPSSHSESSVGSFMVCLAGEGELASRMAHEPVLVGPKSRHEVRRSKGPHEDRYVSGFLNSGVSDDALAAITDRVSKAIGLLRISA